MGALLLLGLLAAPAAAAHRLAGNPYAGIALGGLLAVAAMWGGLALATRAGAAAEHGDRDARRGHLLRLYPCGMNTPRLHRRASEGIA